MTFISGIYQGQLRCQLLHEQSKSEIVTDAPTDNHGKGEAFSPTDLLAAALGSCLITVMAIRARTKKVDIGKPTFSIRKVMRPQPRKISRIEIDIKLPGTIKEEDRNYLESQALKCPVALSLDPAIEQRINFEYV
jgi:uncharacterized OsmC-like protein